MFGSIGLVVCYDLGGTLLWKIRIGAIDSGWALDPIYQGTPKGVRERLVSSFSIEVTEPDYALGYVFDIVLRGPAETPMETR